MVFSKALLFFIVVLGFGSSLMATLRIPEAHNLSFIKQLFCNCRLKRADGRFRYMMRHCLTHRSLHVLVEFLMSKRDDLSEWYYEIDSNVKKKMMAQYGGGSAIVTHEQLAEQLR